MACLAFAALAGLGSITTLLGWALNVPALTDWTGKGLSTFPNAGLAGACCSAALVFLCGNPAGARIVVGRALASVAAAVGLLTLFQHATDINLGIDELLFRGDWGQAGTLAPMRIGIPASLSFAMLGVGIILTTFGPCSRRFAAAIGLITVAVASLSLVGYFFGANQLFGIARFTAIAWPTAIIIAFLSAGLIVRVPEWGVASLLCRSDAGGVVARGLLLPIIAVPLIIGWLRVEGEQAGLFDPTFGAALRTLAEMGLLLGFLWWTATSIGRHALAQKAATEALRATEARFARFMQAHPGPAWMIDAEGRLVFGNESAERVFQAPPGGLVGQTFEKLLPPEDAERFRKSDLAAAKIAAGLQSIETLDSPTGRTTSWLVNRFPVPHPEGGPPWIGGVAIDLTDRLDAENALREAHRRKDEFLAILAHELRNPLAPIRFAVELFKLGGDTADLQAAAGVIERQVQQMARLLDDLLDVSRISHGKLTLRIERVVLGSIVARAVETSRPMLDQASHRLLHALPEEPLWLDVDAMRLAQVISNLLNNAAKFAPQGSEIFLTARREGGSVVISVRDQGIGIPPEMLDGIFELFSQVKMARDTPQGGLGIGLSLVRGLVALHGGSVEARSEGPGRGSEFLIRLPLANPTDPPPTTVEARPLEQPARPYRILVADDLIDGAESLAAILRAAGHDVRTAYNGRSALDAATEFQPELAFLDIGMPQLNGHEVCRAIRTLPWGRDCLIVAVTGWGQENDRRLASAAGFDEHLVKPVETPALAGVLHRLARRETARPA